MLLKPGDLRFLIILPKKCSRMQFLHRNKPRTEKTDTKTEILVLRAYTYDEAEGAEGGGLTENTMQISSDYLQINVPKPGCHAKHPIPLANGKASLSTHCTLQAKQN